ncbi:radical SAM family heme chaperone HemW [Ferrovum sp. PN-J185]|uniref:radical SAM family heme chaperone HemW n=1 Tax=Ferrovum sp. PN-J185 TaxID=1356306 RepID=UPI00079848C2|nr:radical SAM family heme chaperone HemW [Ferrovum sp. PN-J185]KXW56011.1 oxygen-independent coproporphyrinogen-III oxidase-like protein YqeR [Ferrovum sp. PN-J185]MCC6068277.1 radical SAM family heme chaperone HemW [Ferrovum sp. PN-J185]MDE1892288.1 oxygen-independent coproporphyrinogen III oxidase-like protein [Betaproteobacteria bacterium]MDE2056666.1 oxygen-independent coproporphyrinogen III oxidase-like protein [Betaproteobacteria bacterium]
MALTVLPPLSLYVHVPWCIKKCPYCDFNSHELKSKINESQFIDALLTDFQYQLPYIWGRSVRSIFIGGGTPSLLSPESFDRLISGIRSLVSLIPGAEITLEANPGTFETDKFRGFKEAGINRLSLGIQSLNNRLLKVIGRVHDREQALFAISQARTVFDNLNCDLMYGLPNQTHQEALDDLTELLSFNPDHISFYQLTIEPNTYFYKFPPLLPEQDQIVTLENDIYSLLKEYHFDHYEVSAYAQQGKRSQHNLNYWMFGDYVGIGPGAHGKISLPDKIMRTAKIKHPNNYLNLIGKQEDIEERHVVDFNSIPFEFMMNALRLNAGFSLSLFEERTGLSIESIQSTLSLAEKKRFVTISENYLSPTELGRHFLNDLISLFLND